MPAVHTVMREILEPPGAGEIPEPLYFGLQNPPAKGGPQIGSFQIAMTLHTTFKQTVET